MKYLTIDDIKAQLRLDFDCEDSLLELYGNGAEQHTRNDYRKIFKGNSEKSVSEIHKVLAERSDNNTHGREHRRSGQNSYAFP